MKSESEKSQLLTLKHRMVVEALPALIKLKVKTLKNQKWKWKVTIVHSKIQNGGWGTSNPDKMESETPKKIKTEGENPW